MTLTVGSLFSGIGGIELGLERAGFGPVLWQVEKDPYARAVLAKHWPAVARHEDIRFVGATELVPVDIVCGGFPCQDISIAGRGDGLGGERSGLWWEFHRIVGEIRPRYVAIENVSALRSRGLDAVLGSLDALGYDAEWHCVPAAHVGAPHRRDRVWIVAHADRTGCGERWRAVADATAYSAVECGCENVADTARGGQPVRRRSPRETRFAAFCGEGLAHSDSARHAHVREGEAWRSVGDRDGGRDATGPSGLTRRAAAEWWAVEPDVGRVAHGVPSRVDRLRCLGNAVVPQVAEIILGGMIKKHEHLRVEAA